MGKDSGKVYFEPKWYCHACGDGPLNCTLVIGCPMCFHQRCTQCSVVKMQYSSNR